MSATVQQLADLVNGRVVGDGSLVIQAARPLGEDTAGDVTFIEQTKHLPLAASSRAAAVVVPRDATVAGRTVIQVADPLGAFITLVRHLHGRPAAAPIGIDARAVVHPTARLGPNCDVQPFAVIGEGTVIGARCQIHAGVVIGRFCRIGDDTILYPNAVLYDETIVGQRVIVHGNAVLGADGFGYRFQGGRHVKVPQLGHVVIGDDVEVGAGTTIDRGTFKPTRVGEGTKIDNLVQIGHNCQIGSHNLLVSQVGIGGSCTTGAYVVMAGQAGIVDHVNIGDRVTVGGKSGVTQDVPAGTRVLGAPARPERDMKRMMMTLDHLPEIRRDVRRIKQQLGLNDDAEAA